MANSTIDAFKEFLSSYTEKDYGSEAKQIYNAHANATNENTGLESLWNKWTGRGLTNAQVAQNSFNAWQAEEARNFNAEEAAKSRMYNTWMSNTQYQRGVRDMQAAGLNPALMMGGASPAPVGSVAQASGSAASAGSVDNGMSFGEMVTALTLPLQLKQMSADITNTNANTEKTKSETELNQVNTEFFNKTLEARAKGIELSNKLTDAEISNVKAQTKQFDASIDKLIAETKNEYEKRELIRWQTAYQKASAQQISELLPLQKSFLEAQTSNQRANALAQLIHAMYENKMIDSGFIEAQISSMRAHASAALTQASAAKETANAATANAVSNRITAESVKRSNSAKASLDEFKSAIYNGTYFKGDSFTDSFFNEMSKSMAVYGTMFGSFN